MFSNLTDSVHRVVIFHFIQNNWHGLAKASHAFSPGSTVFNSMTGNENMSAPSTLVRKQLKLLPKKKRRLLAVVFSFYQCAPAWNRTKNNGLEVRSYIHLTTGASEEQCRNLFIHWFRTHLLKEIFQSVAKKKSFLQEQSVSINYRYTLR